MLQTPRITPYRLTSPQLGRIAGHDPKDPYSSTAPVPDYQKALGGDLNGLKVGVITEFMESDLVETTVHQAVSKAIATLGELGATVEEVSVPLSMDAGVASAVLLAVEPALAHQVWIKERIQDYGHDVRNLLLTGSLVPAQAYYKAQKLRTMLRQQVLDSLEKYDVLVLPTSGKGAQPLEDDPPITSKETTSRLAFLFTRIFNLASCPAMSVPCGFTQAGLPIGLQLIGRPFEEALLFQAAHGYEAVSPSRGLHPPVAANGG